MAVISAEMKIHAVEQCYAGAGSVNFVPASLTAESIINRSTTSPLSSFKVLVWLLIISVSFLPS